MNSPFCRFKPTLLIVDGEERFFLVKPSKFRLFSFSQLHKLPIDLHGKTVETIFTFLESSSRLLPNDCKRKAYYWITKATYYESIGCSEKALTTYEHCTQFDPQPIEALTLAFRYFLLRIGAQLPDRPEVPIDHSSPERCDMTEGFIAYPNELNSINQKIESFEQMVLQQTAQQSRHCDAVLERIEQLDDELLRTASSLCFVPLPEAEQSVADEAVSIPSICFTPSKLPQSPALKRIQEERKQGRSPLLCKRKLFTEQETRETENESKFQMAKSSKQLKYEHDRGENQRSLLDGIEEQSISDLFANEEVCVSEKIPDESAGQPEEQCVTIKYSLMRTPKKIQQLTQTPLILSPVKRHARTPQPADKRYQVYDSVSEIPSELGNYYYIPNESLDRGGKSLKASTVLNRFLQESQENDSNQDTN